MEFNIRSRFYNGSELQVTGVVRKSDMRWRDRQGQKTTHTGQL
jgi:hypothetical protein